MVLTAYARLTCRSASSGIRRRCRAKPGFSKSASINSRPEKRGNLNVMDHLCPTAAPRACGDQILCSDPCVTDKSERRPEAYSILSRMKRAAVRSEWYRHESQGVLGTRALVRKLTCLSARGEPARLCRIVPQSLLRPAVTSQRDDRSLWTSPQNQWRNAWLLSFTLIMSLLCQCSMLAAVRGVLPGVNSFTPHHTRRFLLPQGAALGT
jgi:hypothetical protein